MMVKWRSAVAAFFAVAALVCTGSAFAGEAQGNFGTTGKYTPIENYITASICAFSGQNPEGYLPPTDPNYEPGRTQSWGQLVAAGVFKPSELKSGDPMPGTSCNGHSGYLAGGGGEG
jgi:hypothetical protein